MVSESVGKGVPRYIREGLVLIFEEVRENAGWYGVKGDWLLMLLRRQVYSSW